MPKINQIPELINGLLSQTVGLTELSVVNANDIVSLGDTVLSSQTNVDDFFGVLADRIGRTIFNVRALQETQDLFLMMDTIYYGAILQKIYVDPGQASNNDTWGLEDGRDYSPFIINKSTVKQKLFSGFSVWQYDVTLPREQLRTAFLGEEQIAAMISCIMTATENNLRLSLASTARIAYANYIAQKIHAAAQTDTKGVHVINILTEYNNVSGQSLTPQQAVIRGDFWRYFAQQVNIWYKRMADMSTLFNLDGYYRHTPRGDIRVTLLQEVASAMNTYLRSDTFHNELVQLPNYNEVNFWQAEGTKYDTATTSAINVNIDVDGTPTAIAANGILAVISDVEAIGMTTSQRRTTSMYNPRTETENIFNKAEVQYFNDLSENGIVFTLGSFGDVPAAVSTVSGARVRKS